MKDTQPTVETLHRRMIRENRSAANYAKGEPMRSVLWKRAENATQRYRAAIAAPLATNTQQHPSRAEQAEQKARVWVVAKEGAK